MKAFATFWRLVGFANACAMPLAVVIEIEVALQ
jgi:hypothetical protein